MGGRWHARYGGGTGSSSSPADQSAWSLGEVGQAAYPGMASVCLCLIISVILPGEKQVRFWFF